MVHRGAPPEQSAAPSPNCLWMAAAALHRRRCRMNDTSVEGCTISVSTMRRALRHEHAPVLNTLNTPPPVERAKRSPLGLKPQRPAEGTHSGQRENTRIRHPHFRTTWRAAPPDGSGVAASADRSPSSATPPPPQTVGERDTRSPAHLAARSRGGSAVVGKPPRGRTIPMVAARVAALRTPGEHRARRAPPSKPPSPPPVATQGSFTVLRQL